MTATTMVFDSIWSTTLNHYMKSTIFDDLHINAKWSMKSSAMNVIPNYDFIVDVNEVIESGFNMIDATKKCQDNPECIGFNSSFYLKRDFTLPRVSGFDFYVNVPSFGNPFAQITGWDTGGYNFPNMPIVLSSVSVCAYACMLNIKYCVGVVWDSSTRECWLKGAFGPPSLSSTRSMLIPVGSGGCPTSVLEAGKCVNPIPYNFFPAFGCRGDDIKFVYSFEDGLKTCESNPECFFAATGGYVKNDCSNPMSDIRYPDGAYIHAVNYGINFVRIKGWNIAGYNLAGMPLILANINMCAFKCTEASGCVGAVWDGSSKCWLKYQFSVPDMTAGSNRFLLFPSGLAGCPTSFIDAGDCVEPVPNYNAIPNFDFTSNNSSFIKAANMTDAISKCEVNLECMGFNSSFYLKTVFSSPVISNTFYYAHKVFKNSSFAQVIGWDSAGVDISDTPITVPHVSGCAYECTIAYRCVGATWNPKTNKCWLKRQYGFPRQNSTLNMLIPVGKGGCSALLFASGNCVESTPYTASLPPGDIGPVCEALKHWHLYYIKTQCWQNVQTNSYYEKKIIFDQNMSCTSFNLPYFGLTKSIPSVLGRLTSLTSLVLFQNLLGGSIPPEIYQLRELQTLLLNNIYLTKGTIATEIGLLTKLTYLWFFSSYLGGSLPTELGNLRKMKSMILLGNHITGSIPSAFGLLTSLHQLIISDNELIGTIPSELSNLISLQYFGVFGNKMSGTLPTQLCQLTALLDLNLDNNLLTIPVPEEALAVIINLNPDLLKTYNVGRSITHSTNSFSGTLPSEYGLMKSLQRLSIDNNLLTGSLPSEFGLLTSLKSMTITANQLTGSIPSEFSKLINLEELRLSNNQLSGSLSSALGKLVSLVNLYLSTNKLTGSIPSEFGLLTNLQQLQLSNNRLTGTIATQLGQLMSVQNIDINTNNFIGTIPSELSNLKSLQFLTFDRNTGLSGNVSNIMCSIQSLERITVSVNVFCPTNCSSKCTRVENIFKATNALPTISPTKFRSNIDPQSSSSLLSSGAIAGIVVGSVFACLAICLSVFYCFMAKPKIKVSPDTAYIYTSDKKPLLGTTEVKYKGIKMISWDDLYIDVSNSKFVIGEGSFGLVIRGQWFENSNDGDSRDNLVSNCKDVAIKLIKKDTFSNSTSDHDNILKEIKIHVETEMKLKRTKSNCIVNFYGVVEGQLPKDLRNALNMQRAVGIVMCYEAGGSLSSILYNKSSTPNNLNTESDIGLNTKFGIDLKTESATDSNTKSDIDLKTESDTGSNTKSGIDLNTESDTGSNTKSDIDSKTESGIDLKNESRTGSITISGIDLKTESGAGSKSRFGLKTESGTGSNANTNKNDEIDLSHKVKILYRIARGLSELHKLGVVHGDLKPDNILLSSKNLDVTEVRITDFGYAELREQSYSANNSSLIMESINQRGTPVYSAPEQLYRPKKPEGSEIYVVTYAKSSQKTDIYAFAILSWEVLTQQKPFSDITTTVDLSLKVYHGLRPDMNKLPEMIPDSIRNMIKACWDNNRYKRLTINDCYYILRKYYIELTTLNMKHDVYVAYKYPSPTLACARYHEYIIIHIRNLLTQKGLKVTWMNDVVDTNANVAIKQKYKLIQESKVILACVNLAYQSDMNSKLELVKNRGFKRPRVVIPVFLDPRTPNFPDNEITAHCYLGRPDTKAFDISHLLTQASTAIDQTSSVTGISSMDIELDSLVDYIRQQIKICEIEEREYNANRK